MVLTCMESVFRSVVISLLLEMKIAMMVTSIYTMGAISAYSRAGPTAAIALMEFATTVKHPLSTAEFNQLAIRFAETIWQSMKSAMTVTLWIRTVVFSVVSIARIIVSFALLGHARYVISAIIWIR